MRASRTVSLRSAFTLVEMLAAVAVLALVILTGSAITMAASNVMTFNNKHMDANGQARMVFDRMANDFARMTKRRDVDYLFWKPANASPTTKGINDTMYFFTEASGYFDSNTFSQGVHSGSGATASSEQNAFTLVGYRVNNLSTSPNYSQLERLGLPLSWDGGTPTGTTTLTGTLLVDMTFLTYPPAGTSPGGGNISCAYDSSTLRAAYPQVGTAAGNYNNGTDTTYDPIGSQVFRMEYSFQLKDGTLSDKPIMVTSSSNGVPSSTITATTHPTYANDSTLAGGSWSVNSRWWDSTNQIGYICVDATPSYAVWHEIGIQDVAAIIVTIAVVDKQALVYLKSVNGDLNSIAAALPDYVPTHNGGDPAYLLNPLDSTSWAAALLPGGAVSSKMSLPQPLISQIRLYQRSFYLDNF